MYETWTCINTGTLRDVGISSCKFIFPYIGMFGYEDTTTEWKRIRNIPTWSLSFKRKTFLLRKSPLSSCADGRILMFKYQPKRTEVGKKYMKHVHLVHNSWRSPQHMHYDMIIEHNYHTKILKNATFSIPQILKDSLIIFTYNWNQLCIHAVKIF